MRAALPILAAITVGALVLAGGSGTASAAESPPDRGQGYDKRQAEQDELWTLSKRVEALGTLPGFAEFTQASAYIESRFNPDVQAGNDSNSARGILQLRPESAFNWRNGLTSLQAQPNLLFDIRWSVAMAADYAYRLIRFNTDAGQETTFWDVRRGWKLPKYTRYPYRATMIDNLQQFLGGIHAVGGSEKLVDQRALITGWPGTQAVLKAVGVG